MSEDRGRGRGRGTGEESGVKPPRRTNERGRLCSTFRGIGVEHRPGEADEGTKGSDWLGPGVPDEGVQSVELPDGPTFVFAEDGRFLGTLSGGKWRLRQ